MPMKHNGALHGLTNGVFRMPVCDNFLTFVLNKEIWCSLLQRSNEYQEFMLLAEISKLSVSL